MESRWAIGAILAAGLAGLALDVLPLGDDAWRWLFAIGSLPAVLILWVNRRVPEPEIWKAARASVAKPPNPYRVLFGPELRRRTLLACLLAGLLQFAYWGLFFWLPNLLASPAEKGGAGMTVVRSTAYLIPLQSGALIRHLLFCPIPHPFRRRPRFAVFLLSGGLVWL